MLIVNADDWGRSTAATDNAALCYEKARISSTTAMVFMADSQRGAKVALELGIEVGLHLNLSQEFNAPSIPAKLRDAQRAICRFLTANRYALLFYNPFLRRQFRRVVAAQLDEFRQLYQREPSHLDGHQHMHLSTNILLDGLLPAGTKVRRSFSFVAGEKNVVNRAYRAFVDRYLARRHRITDYFFALSQNLQPARLQRIGSLARHNPVELMTHPEKKVELDLLCSDEFGRLVNDVRLVSYASL